MAGERVKLLVQNRAVLGSAESRRLRRQGMIPGVLYGREKPVAITITERDLRTAIGGGHGSHAVLDVVVDGGSSHSSVVKEFQLDPIRGYITHVDLQEVRLDQTIQTNVSVSLVGEARGTKEGGVLTQVTNSVNIEALPLEVPDHLEIDVTDLGIGDSTRLSELRVPDGVKLLDDPDTVLAAVALPRAEEPEPVAEGEEAAEAAAEGAADEAAPDADAAPADGDAAESTEE